MLLLVTSYTPLRTAACKPVPRRIARFNGPQLQMVANGDRLTKRVAATPWSASRQAEFATRRLEDSSSPTQHKRRRGSQVSPRNLDDRPVHRCATCSLTFAKRKQLAEHLAGKRHAENEALATQWWDEFTRTPWYDESISRDSVAAAFSLDDFLEGLPRRSRSSRPSDALLTTQDGGDRMGTIGCVSPHVTLSGLPPRKRAQLWRYLRELMPGEPALPAVFIELERAHGRFARVKEILESCETFRHAEAAVLSSRGVGSRGTRSAGANATEHGIIEVFDVACGHGLVGLLLAFRFADLHVYASDLVRRPAYDAYVASWYAATAAMQTAAERRWQPGVRFAEGDFTQLLTASSPTVGGDEGIASEQGIAREYAGTSKGAHGEDVNGIGKCGGSLTTYSFDEHGALVLREAPLPPVGSRSLVLCVHGCNEVNPKAIELARRGGAAWLVVPCCLQQSLYLPARSMRLPDDARYHFLCGAMALAYGAQRVASLDRRITPRALILQGGSGGL